MAPVSLEKTEAILKMEKALKSFTEGKFVMVMDSADREDECDLIIAAESCTPKQMAFMIKHSTGIVCLTTSKDRLEHFGLHPATGNNTDPNGTNFYVSTDYIPGTTTGVSAADRTTTLQAFCDMNNKASDFSKPGHMFPLCANENGVLARQGHTESTYDFCRLSGVKHPVGALAELMHDNGEMFRDGDSRVFAKEHGLDMVYVTDIIEYRHWIAEKERQSKLLECVPVEEFEMAKARMEMSGVDEKCQIIVTKTQLGSEVVMVVKGDVKGQDNVPVRLHSECFTGDTLRSKLCDCGEQLEKFKSVMNESDCAVLVYVKGHEGRGIGLFHKIRAYNLQQERGLDTLDANTALGFDTECRNFDESCEALKSLGVISFKLHSNNPLKLKSMQKHGLTKAEMTPLPSTVNQHNQRYLETKKERSGHQTLLADFKLPVPKSLSKGQLHTASDSDIVLVSTQWNADFVQPMITAARKHLKQSGIDSITELTVPGHMDLVSGARLALRRHKPAVVICMGVAIRGESDGYEHQCAAVAQGLTQLNASQDIPILNSILMCKDEAQARARSLGDANPGKAYAMSALHMMEMSLAEEHRLP